MPRSTLVFYHPRNLDAAITRAEQVDGFCRSVKGWNGLVEEPAETVVVDNAAPHIADAYRDYGAAVEWLFGAPEPEYRVEQSGPWYKLIGPNGEQVGKSQRSEEAAWALLEDD